jgi:hypothetical protein
MSQKMKRPQKQPARQKQMSLYKQLSASAPKSHASMYVERRQWVFGAPVLLTASAGAIVAQAIGADPTASILGWARFSALFDEYRIIGVDCILIPLSDPASTNSCLLTGWWDEVSTAAPTANEAQERELDIMCPSVVGATYQTQKMSWRARDLADLKFVGTTTSFQPVTAKIYSANAVWGKLTGTTMVGIARLRFLLEFRGLKST